MDILHDNSHSILFNLNRNHTLPDYVMSSEALDKEASDQLSDRLFADQQNRQYPIDSAADTWLSAAYFAKTAESDDLPAVLKRHTEDTIKRAADLYGIRSDVDRIMDEIRNPHTSEKKAEDDDSNYGYPEGKMYPMFDEEGVKKACAYFQENTYKYAPEMRHTIARNILKKCASYKMEIPEIVRKEAQVGFPRRGFMSIQIVDRAHRSPDVKIAEQLLSLNDALMVADASEMSGMLHKVAELIENVDHLTGLDQMYGKTVLAPSDFLFDVSVKEAGADLEDTVELGGKYFSIEKLAGLPEDVFTNALGDDFGERIKEAGAISVEKLSDELHSMPTPDKNALYRSIESYAD